MQTSFPYLPKHKNFLYVPMSNRFMQLALETSRKESEDLQHPNASVLVKDGEVLAKGGNKLRIKNKKLIDLHKNGFCVRRLLKIPSGKMYILCPGCTPSRNHSEQTAIKNALHANIDLKDADLYLWGHWWCCKPCWDAIIKAGITNVYLLENSEVLFNRDNPNNKIGDFDYFLNMN